MSKRAKRIGVLFSGGLDSAVLVGQLLKQGCEVWPIYISCGLPWEKAERYWAHRFLRKIRSKNLKPLLPVRLLLEGAYKKNWSQTGKTPSAKSNDEEVFLPGRNLLLITKSLLALSSKNIWSLALATLKGNPFPDATVAYFKATEKLLSKSFLRGVKISAPFRKFSKTQVLRSNRDLPLHLSFSCISPMGRLHCGTCNKCAERQRAFRAARVSDPTRYAARDV